MVGSHRPKTQAKSFTDRRLNRHMPQDQEPHKAPLRWHEKIWALPGEKIQEGVYATRIIERGAESVFFLSITANQGAKGLPPGLYAVTSIHPREFHSDSENSPLYDLGNFIAVLLQDDRNRPPVLSDIPQGVIDHSDLSPKKAHQLQIDVGNAFQLMPTGKIMNSYTVIEIAPISPSNVQEVVEDQMRPGGYFAVRLV